MGVSAYLILQTLEAPSQQIPQSRRLNQNCKDHLIPPSFDKLAILNVMPCIRSLLKVRLDLVLMELWSATLL